MTRRAIRLPGTPLAAEGQHPAVPEGPYDRVLSAAVPGANVSFRLQRVAGGLYVEREAHPGPGPRVQLHLVCKDLDAFYRWCDEDPVRFEHPGLYLELKRQALELWRIDTGSDAGR